MDRDSQKDLRNAFIVALIAMTLFVYFLFQLGSKGGRQGYDLINRIEEARQPAGRSQPAAVMVNAQEVPVLCHHFFRGDTSPLQFIRIVGGLLLSLPVLSDWDVWSQSVREFEREMEHLHRTGYTSIDLDTFVAWRRGEVTIPEKSVVITFDDGDRSAKDVALPILQKYGFTATMFVVTRHVGEDWDEVEGLTWEELAEMEATGVFKVESHSHGLHFKSRTPKGHLPAAVAMSLRYRKVPEYTNWRQVILDDLSESRRLIEEHLGHPSNHLAWPYGGTNAALDSIAVEAGFQTMSTLQQKTNDPINADSPTRAARRVYNVNIVEDFLTSGVPTFIPQYAATRFSSERYTVNRYIVNARTSIREFKKMLAQ
jgi:peptidoglycan/xylan/chitin deacetylase (PgdA/CDA1 family)